MPYFQENDDFDQDADTFAPEPLLMEVADCPEAPGVSADEMDTRLALALNVLRHVHESIGHVVQLLETGRGDQAHRLLAELVTEKTRVRQRVDELSGVRVVEGVFNGTAMVGPDGQAYAVPPNYASKSRLVEGDVMKLTIHPNGTFIFKQIGPIDRRRLVGRLAYDTVQDIHVVTVESGVSYQVLTASITFHKAQPGDEMVVLTPKSGKSLWAAVEHVLRK